MAANSHFSPSWQRDQCPSWCVTEHGEDDLPEDRIHDSAPRYVPVILGVRDSNVSAPQAQTTELLIIISRRCDDTDDWVFIGEPDQPRQRLLLSPESASRVARSILDQVAYTSQ